VGYIGIGPSAHSFNGLSRQWNRAHNRKYISSIVAGEIPAEVEQLSVEDQVNEYIMTSLRTSRGMNIDLIAGRFGDQYVAGIMNALPPFIEKGWVTCEEQLVILTRAGKLFADHIASELFTEGADGRSF
jgi:oxygen-independent coproporphyrinogen-3 oxidase